MKKAKKVSTEKLIEYYHRYLESYEKVEYDELPPDLIRLRNHVLFVHSTIESLLHFFICGHIARSFGWKKSTPSAAMSLFTVQPFLEQIDYARLVSTCREQKIISKEVCSKLMTVNNHRVMFAHQNAKQKEIEKYQDKEVYLKVLEDLSDGLTAVTEATQHWSKYLDEEDQFREKIEKQAKLASETNEVK